MPEGPFVEYVVRRDFPFPVEKAFAWLTDYQDDDPSRTTHVVKRRPVLERSANRVLLDGTLEVLGNRRKGKAEVLLSPPNHWEARIIEGQGRGSLYVYHLDPAPGGSRLTVTYKMRARRLSSRVRLFLFRPFVVRELHKMWDGFTRSMNKDLGK